MVNILLPLHESHIHRGKKFTDGLDGTDWTGLDGTGRDGLDGRDWTGLDGTDWTDWGQCRTYFGTLGISNNSSK